MVLDDGGGYFTSQNFPFDVYNDNSNCTWEIFATGGSHVWLRVESLSLNGASRKYSQFCVYDYISIYDGTPTNGQLLGK